MKTQNGTGNIWVRLAAQRGGRSTRREQRDPSKIHAGATIAVGETPSRPKQ